MPPKRKPAPSATVPKTAQEAEELPKAKRGGKAVKVPAKEDVDTPEEMIEKDAEELPKAKRGRAGKEAPKAEPEDEAKPKRGARVAKAAKNDKSSEKGEEDDESPLEPKKNKQAAESDKASDSGKSESSEKGEDDDEPPPKLKKGKQAPESDKASDSGKSDKSSEKGEEDDEEPPKPKKGKQAAKEKPETNGAKAKKKAKEETKVTVERTRPVRQAAIKKPQMEDDGGEGDDEEKPKAKKGRAPKEKPDKAEPKQKKVKKETIEKAPAVNQGVTDYDKIVFECTKLNALEQQANFKITSWNVDGLRAWAKKGGLTFLEKENPDVICLQETKCGDDKLPDEVKDFGDYKKYWIESKKAGYAGVAIFSKEEPIEIKYGINDEEQDDEGRCITTEFEKFYLVTVYVPNAGRKLVTLPKRLEWNKIFKSYVLELNKTKPVIVCGDLNVAHEEIDLANPKSNHKNAGFTQEERDGMTDFLGSGFVDTFRKFYPDEKEAYTFWTYMMKARAKNIGWRLDYFLVSEELQDKICDSRIRHEVYGSDHCPITLFMNI